MQDLAHIQKSLLRGDKKRIAELTGSSLDMVIKVLKGERPSTAPKGRLIIEAARQIITHRIAMQEYFDKKRKQL